jgi:uncharacterized protein YjbI with pentapeptide repeats/GTPase SAR1 family protein
VALGFTNNQKKETENSVSNRPKKIITDEPLTDAEDFENYSRKLSEFIVNSTPRFTVGIFGGWGTGKTTLMQMIRNELEQNYRGNIVTAWFDSWRYENEQYSAMIPLLRTITINIKNGLENVRNSGSQTKIEGALTRLSAAFTKVGNIIIRNTTANVGIKAGDIIDVVSTLDIGKMMDDYQSDGSFIMGQERIYYHKHISEHLEQELHKIRYDEGFDFRLVVFVDDLDRCTPDKALELLESIKTFFDIEGVIYVIGMDSRTIDPIIKTKYGEGTIDGMDYLQKIVQLPFQIPVWNAEEISKTIRNTISKTGMAESYINELMKTSTELIISAAKLNPRDVKRFINTVIISTYIYEQNIEDIDKLIAIQAFYFRGSKWIDFLKLITIYKIRIDFLKKFILWKERLGRDPWGRRQDGDSTTTFEDFKKFTDDVLNKKSDFALDKSTTDIFRKLTELNDNDLFLFIKTSADTLIKIDEIDRYLRALDPIVINASSQISSPSDVTTERLLQLLSNGNVSEFNNLREQKRFLIHLPYEYLVFKDEKGKIKDLSKINLSNAFLFSADLHKAKLSAANLSSAELSVADLSEANLSKADLSSANLDYADLDHANLSKAKLYKANMLEASLVNANFCHALLFFTNLTKAFMISANLSSASLARTNLSFATLDKANLSFAHLAEVDLTSANLSQANLSSADLTEVNLSNTELQDASLINAILINISDFTNLKANKTKFDNAIIDNADFIDYLVNKTNAENVPKKIKNKLELKAKLEGMKFKKEVMDYFLSKTRLR